MRHFLTVGICILTLSLFVGTLFTPALKSTNLIFEGSLHSLSLESTVIDVAIADTVQTRRLGLSNLPSLPKGSGLFFVFKDSGMHGIWMKDTEFPIDIIWMDEGLRVIDIHRDISPDSYPEIFRPQASAQFALEVDAGFSLKHDVKIGSTYTFPTH